MSRRRPLTPWRILSLGFQYFTLIAVSIIVLKNRATRREQDLLDSDPVRVPEGMRILPEDTREYVRQLESLPPEAGIL